MKSAVCRICSYLGAFEIFQLPWQAESEQEDELEQDQEMDEAGRLFPTGN